MFKVIPIGNHYVLLCHPGKVVSKGGMFVMPSFNSKLQDTGFLCFINFNVCLTPSETVHFRQLPDIAVVFFNPEMCIMV